ncbi:MAG: hypothetical protein WD355_06510 [Balneolaceae bacterium]
MNEKETTTITSHLTSSPLKVIVLGSGNSGSGAVYDYLAGRPDVHAPLSQEFRLIQDPGGLSDLYHSIANGFYLNRASAAIREFREFAIRYGRPKNSHPPGLDYETDIPGYSEKIEQFVEQITEVSYAGLPGCERAKFSPFQSWFWDRKRRKAKARGEKPTDGTVYLPITKERFLEEAENFLDRLLNPASGSSETIQNIAINQGGSFWSPWSSTRYFGENRKVIVVSRDPRGIYSSQRVKGYAYPGGDVHQFCDWFDAAMKHIDREEWGHPEVLHVRYEEFVTRFEEGKVQVDSFLGIDESVQSVTDIEQSARNATKYQDRISNEEIRVICERLKDYLQIDVRG